MEATKKNLLVEGSQEHVVSIILIGRSVGQQGLVLVVPPTKLSNQRRALVRVVKKGDDHSG